MSSVHKYAVINIINIMNMLNNN